MTGLLKVTYSWLAFFIIYHFTRIAKKQSIKNSSKQQGLSQKKLFESHPCRYNILILSGVYEYKIYNMNIHVVNLS